MVGALAQARARSSPSSGRHLAAIGVLTRADRRAPLHVGAIGGLLVAPGALIAISLWTSGRTNVFRFEIALAFFLGAAPGLIVYYLLFKNATARATRPHGMED